MSKSIGNVVSPENIIGQYGADTARLFILFAAPPEKELDWSDAGVEGAYRFLNRVYRLVYDLSEKIAAAPRTYDVATQDDKDLLYTLHSAIEKVTEDTSGRFQFNTAIASIMELVNGLYKYKELAASNYAIVKDCIENLIVILSPFTPHICEEMWQHLGHDTSVYQEPWPQYDEKALIKDTVEIVVQINGRIKEKLNMPNDLDKNEFEKAAMEDEKVKALVDGLNIVKVVSVPGKLINIVVK